MSHQLQLQLRVFGLALCSLFSMLAAAQGSGPARTKIGAVSSQEAILATDEGKKESETIQQRFGPRGNALKAQNEEVEKLKSQLQAQSDKLSDAERAKRVKEISDKQKTLQRSYEDFQAEVQQAEQEIMTRLGQKMLKVLEKYADKNGYAIILDTANPQTPVAWVYPGNNINKELVEAYNAENPVSGVPAAGAAKPATPAAPKPAATTPKKP
jgi:outer membrane protein